MQLNRGTIKISSNRMNSLEVGLTLMEDKLKEQVVGMMFVLCGNSVLYTHIPNNAIFAHQDHHMEMAIGRFPKMSEKIDVKSWRPP